MSDRKAHHNALERKRRDEIKNSFDLLKDVIPIFDQMNVRPTRARITEEAVKFIHSHLNGIEATKESIDKIKDKSARLEESIRLLEKAKESGNSKEALNFINQNISSEDMSENSETEEKPSMRKNLAKQYRVVYRRKQRPLSNALNRLKKKKNKSSKSLKKYSSFNISAVESSSSDVETAPSDVETALSDVETAPPDVDHLLYNPSFQADEICSKPSDIENESNSYSRGLFESYVTNIKEEPYFADIKEELNY